VLCPVDPSCSCDEESTDDHDRSADRWDLLKSFDMLFRLHQRCEDIRGHMDKIDRVLLTARSIPGMTRRVIRFLEKDLDLVAARLLIREDHHIALLLRPDPPEGAVFVPPGFLQSEGLLDEAPFILDDPSGDLGQTIFGDDAQDVYSAVVAALPSEEEELGVLCLGSNDPLRFCGGMNTDLIAALAEKVSLGLRNAWDHERRVLNEINGQYDGAFSETFFRLLLQREFDRAWRYRRPFSVIAMAWEWRSPAVADPRPAIEVAGLLSTGFRSTDALAHADCGNFWVLLPETEEDGAAAAAKRVIELATAAYQGNLIVHAGVTGFSRAAAMPADLPAQARLALAQAQQSERDLVVVKPLTLQSAGEAALDESFA
jgi:uncharacterized protein YigA (DUF484 family)